MSIIASMKGPTDVAVIGGLTATFLHGITTIGGAAVVVLGFAWYCVLFYDRFFNHWKTIDQADDEQTGP